MNWYEDTTLGSHYVCQDVDTGQYHLSINLPLKIKAYDRKTSAPKAKDFFILNLNNFRNLNYRKLNTAKHNYHNWIINELDNSEWDLKALFNNKKFTIDFDYWHPMNKKVLDPSNPISIIEKFTMDGLVHWGLMKDDGYKWMDHHEGWRYHGVARPNGRCIINIKTIEEAK